MSKLRPVGVLGGMGPQATVLFQQRLIDAVDAADDADHVPLLIDMNPQVPSRLGYLLEGQGENPGAELARMARGLEQAGAEALVMPCNTAHHFAHDIRAAVDIPLLHMVDMACKVVAARLSAGGKVGILASPATEKIRLFHKAFAPYDLEPVFPDDNDAVLGAIRTIKSRGANDEARQALAHAAKNCIAKGAGCLFVGCSEFSLIADAATGAVPTVDSVDVLVEETCAFAGAKRRV